LEVWIGYVLLMRWLDHAEKLTDLPDEQMADILPTCKKLAAATVSRTTDRNVASVTY
jgi:diadenosine tetraphosphate (Ap4A) HIT family hydrolase